MNVLWIMLSALSADFYLEIESGSKRVSFANFNAF